MAASAMDEEAVSRRIADIQLRELDQVISQEDIGGDDIVLDDGSRVDQVFDR